MSGTNEMMRRDRSATDRRLDLLVLLLLEAGLLLLFPPTLILSSTTISGGDTPSHLPTLAAIAGRLADFPAPLVFWNHGHFAGFPMFLNYFPLPFALMALPSLAAPLEIAFKLGTLLAVLPLPSAVYGCLWHLGFRRSPVPLLGGVFSVTFLCMTENSMWGGNLASTLAGELAYAMGFAAAVYLTGKAYGDIGRNRGIVHNAFWEAAIALCNGYPLLQFSGGTGFFLFSRDRRTWLTLLKLHTLAFGLAAFFLVPLLARLPWTTPFHHAWHFQGITEFLPSLLWPALAGIPLGWLGRRLNKTPRNKAPRGCLPPLPWGEGRGEGKTASCAPLTLTLSPREREFKSSSSGADLADQTHARAETYLWWQVGVALLGFGVGPFLGLVDIRFLPFAQIYLVLLGAVGWTIFAGLLPGSRFWLAAVAVASLLAALPHTTQLSAWIQWNYSGFEAKPLWSAYSQVQGFLRGDADSPRVFYEHAAENNEAGTPRAFELLPHFSGRSTLEGIYMQSSVSSPFVFNLQSELSQTPSCPLQDYAPSRIDADRAAAHLKLFNVSHVVAVTRPIMDVLDRSPAFLPEVTLPPYRIYRLADTPSSYVVPVRFKPRRIPMRGWKTTQFDWFRLSSLDVPLVVEPSSPPADWVFWKSLPPFSGDLRSIPREPLSPGEKTAVEATARLGDNRLEITTSHPGHPLWIKVSYHPDWRITEGGGELYAASPAFMILVPRSSRTVLRFSPYGGPYALGLLLTGVAGVAGIGLVVRERIRRRRLLHADSIPPKEGEETTAGHPPTPSLPRGTVPPFRAWALLILATAGFILMRDRNDPILLYYKASEALEEARSTGSTPPRELKALNRAETLFRDCVDRFPHSTVIDQTVLGLALCLIQQGNNPRAEIILRSHLDSRPDTRIRPEILYHLGLCAEKDARIDEARTHWWTLLHDHPESPYAVHAAGLLIRGGSAEPVFHKAEELLENDDFARAQPLLQVLSQRRESPFADESTLLLGQTLFHRNLWSDAARTLALWSDRHPADPRTPSVLVTLAQCLINTGQAEAARSPLQQALALAPSLLNDPSVRTFRETVQSLPAGTAAQAPSASPFSPLSTETVPP